ncbi:hypothetical protein G7070_04860 [Propioniciclava coleopterorum]|uniref:Uncharacterized protein n=1 Tax=Propioniciclava coleopterorum TaxID=2714937 RepID=A0A6G7Y4I0_9ACTN|nr:DUF6541 family protein [Propioniciclava coleopterorum]QIK71725.1 hypothetical protein G7070_04860 [Propioniciclava coleopterorum]
MTWTALIPSLAIAAALLLLPGYLVTRAWGAKGATAAALAPAASTTVVAVGAVAAGALRIPWVWSPLVLALALAAAGALVRLGMRRLARPAAAPRPRPETEDAPRASAWWWVAAWVIGAAFNARHFRNVFDSPDAFSQTFDNVWHLNAVRYIVDTGNASSLTVASLNTPAGGSTFYPAAFHDLAALVMLGNGGHLTFAINAVLAVVCIGVWPPTALYLVRSILPARPATILAAGVFTASLTAFPLLMLEFGVLYPNLLGLALLPALVGLAVQLLGLGRAPLASPALAIALGALSLPGLALAHPNVVMLLLLIGVPLAASYAIRQGARALRGATPWRFAAPQIAAAVAFIVVVYLAWPVLRPPVAVDDWGPAPLDPPAAFGYALLNTPIYYKPAWVVSAFMLLGIFAAVRHGMLWLVAAWGTVVAFWMVIASWALSEFRLLLVGIWYQDAHRFAANLAILALPLAALGVEWLTRVTEQAWARVRPLPVWFAPVFAVAIAVALAGTTQRANYMNHAVEMGSGLYKVTADSAVIDQDEYALLQRVPELVPADATIAVNPWNGSALAYGLAGRQVTAPHVLYGMTPEREVVADRLDEAASDPGVCPLLREGRVRYALDFGDREIHGGEHPYPGFDSLASSRGFEEIAREGHAALYRITACG